MVLNGLKICRLVPDCNQQNILFLKNIPKIVFSIEFDIFPHTAGIKQQGKD
jgi:hypothetical protein